MKMEEGNETWGVDTQIEHLGDCNMHAKQDEYEWVWAQG